MSNTKVGLPAASHLEKKLTANSGIEEKTGSRPTTPQELSEHFDRQAPKPLNLTGPVTHASLSPNLSTPRPASTTSTLPKCSLEEKDKDPLLILLHQHIEKESLKIANSKQKYAQTIGQLAKDKLWFMYIDPIYKDASGEFFEKTRFDQYGNMQPGEEGYQASMEKAFTFLSTNIYTKLNNNFIINLHNIATAHLNSDAGILLTSDLLNIDVHYGMTYEFISPAALAEYKQQKNFLFYDTDQNNKGSQQKPRSLKNISSYLQEHPEAYNYPLYIYYKHPKKEHYIMITFLQPDGQRSEDMVLKNMEQDIAVYYQDLANAKTNKDKLLAIATLCKKLEMNHYFLDGNQRTTVFLLLNKCLLENNLDPAMIFDPTIFDGYRSPEELVEIIQVGQEIFKIKQQNEKPTLLSHTPAGIAAYLLLTTDILKEPLALPEEFKKDPLFRNTAMDILKDAYKLANLCILSE